MIKNNEQINPIPVNKSCCIFYLNIVRIVIKKKAIKKETSEASLT